MIKPKNTSFFCSILDNAITAPPLTKISEWAERDRFMTSKTTATAGHFSWDNAPYWKEVVDNFSPDSPIREVAVMKGTQVGCTTSVYENILGFLISEKATSCVFVTGDKQMQKDFKKIKIDPMIDNTVGLRAKVKSDSDSNNSRKTGDTQSLLEYDNGKQGFIRFCGSHNKNDFQSIHYQYALVDEVDSFSDNVGGDGDIPALIEQRTMTFKEKAKIGYMSRPSMLHTSIILQKYLNGDQRKWNVPCPYCGEYQTLEFYNANGGLYPDEKGVLKDGAVKKPYGISFDSEQCKSGNYSSVAYKCKHCGEEFSDSFQYEMNKKGYWQPTAKAKFPNYRSYHFNGLYVASWKIIVKQFLEAGTDPNKLQVFHNSILGLPFEDSSSTIESRVVLDKRKTYANNFLPNGVLFLVASADVQDDRIELEIKACGDNFRIWGIDHRIIKGNTSDSLDNCWVEFGKLVDEKWSLPNGKELYLERIGVDSGDGEKTDLIYGVCRKYGGDYNVMLPIKGFISSMKTREGWKLAQMKDKGISLFEIYVDLYKHKFTKWAQLQAKEGEPLPMGYMDWAGGYSDEYFRQLGNEKKVKEKTVGGLVRYKWVKSGKNECFDLNVYALALIDLTIWAISTTELELETSSPSSVFEFLTADLYG